MSDYKPVPEGKDPVLWEIAQKRAGFKNHVVSYVVINTFFWVLWYFTGQRWHEGQLPWPVWPMLGWGIGLAFNFINAYVFPKANSTETEYQKLKAKQ